MAEHRDLVVIGSGPGGYVAAIRAAQLGMQVAVVEKDPRFGGTCLHRGCIPTKALLHTASVFDEVRRAEEVGVGVSSPVLDLPRAHAYKRGVVEKNARGVEYLFKKNRIEGIRGRARLVGPHEVAVIREDGAQRLQADRILVATGSVPRDLPFAAVDGEAILNSDHILELEEVPASLVVLGAGAVGAEFASLYRSFGSEVTLVEMLPRILPNEDEEVSRELTRAFQRRGIAVHVDTRLKGVTRTETGLALALERRDEALALEAQRLLVAVGRAPSSQGIGLEELGVEVDNGYIRVNSWMQTSLPHVYAIGDVVNTPWLAHVASAEGILAAEHMAGGTPQPLNYDHVPACTYCDPEVASVGLSEEEARRRGLSVACGKFPFSASGKAAILGRTTGFVKVVRETTYDELLGVHIIGPHATDLIAEAGVALRVESTTEELFRTVHAHPTLSEAILEAAHAASGHGIHG